MPSWLRMLPFMNGLSFKALVGLYLVILAKYDILDLKDIYA